MKTLLSLAMGAAMLACMAGDAVAQDRRTRNDPWTPRYQQEWRYTNPRGYTNLERRNRDYRIYGDTPSIYTYPPRRHRSYYWPGYSYGYPQYQYYNYAPGYYYGGGYYYRY